MRVGAWELGSLRSIAREAKVSCRFASEFDSSARPLKCLLDAENGKQRQINERKLNRTNHSEVRERSKKWGRAGN